MSNSLEYAIKRVVEKIDNFINDKEINRNEDFYKGMSLAYKIVIETLQNSLESDDADLNKLGLDFDTDNVL